jgi:pSer/pThr/pTyr-binding forkhead associated (FHA) protein
MSQARVFLKKVSDGVELEIAGETPVGREEKRGLALKENEASRTHARFLVTNGDLFVEDLKSRNGTFVNGQALPAGELRKLASGDRVRFVKEEFIVRQEVPVANETVPAAVTQQEARAQDAPRMPAWVMGRNEDGTQRVSDEDRQFAIELAKKRLQLLAAPDDVDAPHLSVIEGGRPGRTVMLRPTPNARSEWVIGRSSDCNVVFDVPGVSSVHATIASDRGKWEISDQLSSNGTWVNGAEIRRLYLGSGDLICFGPVECVFRLPGRSPAKKAEVVTTKKEGVSLVTIALISFAVAVVLFAGVFWLLS